MNVQQQNLVNKNVKIQKGVFNVLVMLVMKLTHKIQITAKVISHSLQNYLNSLKILTDKTKKYSF